MTSGEIGTGLTCDSQYFEIYNSQYIHDIEILCIYSQHLNILFFSLPVYGERSSPFGVLSTTFDGIESNRKAMNRNWRNQKANPALKTKREINKYYK